jgi:zinc protease
LAEDMRGWTVDKLEAHYRMGYAPNNCVLVVVGDVTADRAYALARKYFENIPAHDTPPPVRLRERRQDAERRVVISRPAQLAVALYSYHAPASADPGHYAVRLLGAVLAEGRSSRLHRALVANAELANSVSWSYPLSLDPGQLTFAIEARNGADLGLLEKTAAREFDALISAPTSSQEMERARSLLVANLCREMKTLAGTADQLGKYQIYFGSYRKLFSVAADLERVSATDVQQAAAEYLARRNRTVAILLPQDADLARESSE